MTKYHVSDDGIARVCRAETENACRVKGALKGEHFNTSEEAQEAYETTQNPQPKSLKKKSTNTSTKERKKLKPKDLDQDLSNEETKHSAATSSSDSFTTTMMNAQVDKVLETYDADPGETMTVDGVTVVFNGLRTVDYRSDCTFCASVGPNAFAPSHTALPTCKSGKNSHCTCDSCF